ncbi:hypothetical protein QJS04_geneDACA002944 [Acorus gramineus]|uniref:Wall-associated receptor kinase galacturonan-binding domain-containing protein n=1 Tax=Acorus gramineus TaxID=55184 RepID=A0AAV9BT80_ACOGR|nr:hypothetical protein QJS04_geneDACA002944 [Acorus gramineus]
MIYVFAYHSKGEVQCSASCGSLRNISHPFRLQGDPNNCGDPNYVLSCVNNRTRLNLQSKIYHVNSISYDNQTIRVVDSGLKSDNCSSLPLFSLTSIDFSSSSSYTSVTYSDQYIAYVNCSSTFEDSSYVSTRPCINSTSESFLYVLSSDRGRTSNLKESCEPIALVPTSLADIQNMSYVDVWDSLLAGFELSWRPSLCGKCEDDGGSCSYPDSYENPFVCYNPCRRLLQSTKCKYHPSS